MYTGADTCCQQPYALAVTCDHPQHPPVIYNSAGTSGEDGVPAGVRRARRGNQSVLAYTRSRCGRQAHVPGVFIVCTVLWSSGPLKSQGMKPQPQEVGCAW